MDIQPCIITDAETSGIGEKEGAGGNVGKVTDGNGLKHSGDPAEHGEMTNVLLIGLH